MITMLLGGLWHGASWNFVIWGGLHGFYLVVQHLFPWRLPKPLARLLTLACVLLAWIPFRAENLAQSWAALGSLGRWSGGPGFFAYNRKIYLLLLITQFPYNSTAIAQFFAESTSSTLAPTKREITRTSNG